MHLPAPPETTAGWVVTVVTPAYRPAGTTHRHGALRVVRAVVTHCYLPRLPTFCQDSPGPTPALGPGRHHAPPRAPARPARRPPRWPAPRRPPPPAPGRPRPRPPASSLRRLPRRRLEGPHPGRVRLPPRP